MQKRILVDPETERYAENHVSWPTMLAQKISQETDMDLNYSDMLSGNQVTGLLRMLIFASSAKRIAEIGVFTGYATLAMAEALPDDGELWGLEMNERYLKLAEACLRQSDSWPKIRIVRGSARERISELPSHLDLVFLDADKEYYPVYYEVIMDKLRTGGLLVIDNVFWHGGVLSVEKDRKSEAIAGLNDRILRDSRTESVMLTIRDGLTIVRKC